MIISASPGKRDVVLVNRESFLSVCSFEARTALHLCKQDEFL